MRIGKVAILRDCRELRLRTREDETKRNETRGKCRGAEQMKEEGLIHDQCRAGSYIRVQ